MKKLSFIILSAIFISASAFAQTTVAPVKGANVKVTLKPANRKIIDPNTGIFRAPIPPANEHYKSTPANKPSETVLTQSTAAVKASTPLPVITSAQSKMTRAMTMPANGKVAASVDAAKPKTTAKAVPLKYKGKKISSIKPGPRISKASAVKTKPIKLKPVAKKPQSNKERMFNSIYHH